MQRLTGHWCRIRRSETGMGDGTEKLALREDRRVRLMDLVRPPAAFSFVVCLRSLVGYQ